MNTIARVNSHLNLRSAGWKWTVLLGMFAGVCAAESAWAQGQIATGNISSLGAGPYTYNLSFGDAANATSPIGSVWYAWVPGQFYLPGTPSSAFAPSGWTATVSGASVQFVATSPANYILAGQSLSGFGYQAAFTPAQLAAAPNSGVSVAYSAGLFSDPGNTFSVVAVPEPSTLTLLVAGAMGLWCTNRRRTPRTRN